MFIVKREVKNYSPEYLWSASPELWNSDQRGALRFADRGEAHRMAYAYGWVGPTKVVRLVSRSTRTSGEEPSR